MYLLIKYGCLFIGLVCLMAACTKPESKLFKWIPSDHSGIHFINQLQPTEEFNTYTFRNFYNGAGVALGDVNNDGWVDIYFCGNSVDNKLYLNKGEFRFEDVTEKAGVGCPNIWSTGASMADINGDGWLDIYVCKSGPPGGPNRYNELFINRQDGTFQEQARQWAVADMGLSIHAAFFDYDKDGDLDLYLLNNSLRSIGTGNDLQKINREIRDPNGGNKLYKNEGDHFVDYSEEAGIYGSPIGFGLGVTIGDLDRDGWQDIFVSNDFFEKDYLYINQGNGTFQEQLEEYMREVSMGSMGADLADLTNDGYPELFVTEMLPEEDTRYKTKTQFEDWNTYQLKVNSGFYKQFGRNMLQLNNGQGSFSEIGRLSGVEATDWSWGALIFDMDADGWKDMFVANGIYKDLLDQDYANFYSNPERVRELIRTEEQAILTLVDQMPSEALANYAFRNNKDLTFSNLASKWGLDHPSFSNGSAYGDLDNDGDLDLVVNNVNMPPFVYQNLSKEMGGVHTLTLELRGEGKNTFGLGAQVTLYAGGIEQYQELSPMRGFQSCIEPRIHFGLGNNKIADSVVVQWNSGKKSFFEKMEVDKIMVVKESEATPLRTGSKQVLPQQNTVFSQIPALIDFHHQENSFSDFDRDRLLFQMVSAEGPRVAIGDANADGKEDIYICGAKDQSGALLLQQSNGRFFPSNKVVWEQDKVSEDTDCHFFDADKDQDLDLYVTSGGNEFPSSSTALVDRLYINDGKGNFTRSDQILPGFQFESSSCVKDLDFDKDGDRDLFVGTRLRPFLYGVPSRGYLLENDGKGRFTDVTKQLAPALLDLGMITDAVSADIDNDFDQDLLVVGDWMAVTVFVNGGGQFATPPKRIAQSSGLWKAIKAADLDHDGDLDFVACNQGLNARIEATAEAPLGLYINDFDQNGSIEHILTRQIGSETFPFVQKGDLVTQLPGLKKKYLKFGDYTHQTISDIFSSNDLQRSVVLQAHELRTSLFVNDGKGNFRMQPLPVEAQIAPMYGIALQDFDKDGNADILLGGNLYRSKPEFGIYDASYGVFFKGDGQLNFRWIPNKESGFFVKGEIRDVEIVEGKWVVVAKNDAKVEVFRF